MARQRLTAEPSGYTILIVDDQEESQLSGRLLLEREGHRVLTASTGEEALSLFRHHRVDLVIVDYVMPGLDGEKIVQAIRALDENVQILLQTGYASERPPREMLRALAIQGYHDKSEGPERLLLWVDVALKAATQLIKVRETEQFKAQLLARERLKDELVSIVSHELRTPLTSMRGFAELLLQRGFPPEKQREFLTIIHSETVRLTNLINNFLDLQRMEAGCLAYKFATMELVPLLREVVAVFALEGDSHSLQLEVSEPLPPIRADADQLRQVLFNLLSNAVKFSPHGGEVKVGACRKGTQVTVWVADQGIGMSEESKQKLFTKFYRADNLETRQVRGSGLGLALVKKIIEAHHGQVWVESELGVGSTFFFTLPVAAYRTEAPEKALPWEEPATALAYDGIAGKQGNTLPVVLH